MSQHHLGKESLTGRMLDRLPRDVADSLSDHQVSAITRALEAERPRRQPINIRLSIPLPGRRVFLVVLGGSEQRSAERRLEDRRTHALWTFSNACALAFGLLFVAPAVIGLVHMVGTAISGP